jgi:hypothetical protein
MCVLLANEAHLGLEVGIRLALLNHELHGISVSDGAGVLQ